MNDAFQTDVLVIGSGLGGLAAAWEAAKRGCAVTLLTRASNPEDSNTYRAQGGIIYRAGGESPEQLVADILLAGAGLSSPVAASLPPTGPVKAVAATTVSIDAWSGLEFPHGMT